MHALFSALAHVVVSCIVGRGRESRGHCSAAVALPSLSSDEREGEAAASLHGLSLGGQEGGFGRGRALDVGPSATYRGGGCETAKRGRAAGG